MPDAAARKPSVTPACRFAALISDWAREADKTVRRRRLRPVSPAGQASSYQVCFQVFFRLCGSHLCCTAAQSLALTSPLTQGAGRGAL